ncbi:MAG: outer membrane lipoprotein-sorting protein [Myxococcaceae bacterium]
MKTILLSFLVLFSGAAFAQDTAKEISQKSRERGSLNLLGLTVELKLSTTAKDGTTKEQVLTSSAKKIDGRDHSIARFSQPTGVAGVAVLTVAGKGDDAAEISLFLPKLKRVRKVAKTQRGQSFMDTDFSYADLGGTGDTPDSSLKRIGDQKIDGREVFVLTGTAGPDSPYGEVTVFVDKETYVPLRGDYKDKAGKPYKLYRSIKLKKFKERTIAATSVMENLQTGSKTQVEVLKLEESKWGDEAFTERALERG